MLNVSLLGSECCVCISEGQTMFLSRGNASEPPGALSRIQMPEDSELVGLEWGLAWRSKSSITDYSVFSL